MTDYQEVDEDYVAPYTRHSYLLDDGKDEPYERAY
jgi:hypothetical protein